MRNGEVIEMQVEKGKGESIESVMDRAAAALAVSGERFYPGRYVITVSKGEVK